METFVYKPKGVCSTEMRFQLEGDVISGLEVINGCNGNLKAVGRLVEGKDAKEIADILRGNDCQMRGTSCADQLAQAIDQAMA